MSSGAVHVIHVAPPPMHSGCRVMRPGGMPQPCRKHGPVRIGPIYRSCGEVGVGIGWHLSVSSMSCHAGTALVRRYFSGSNYNDGVRTVMGYKCTASAFQV